MKITPPQLWPGDQIVKEIEQTRLSRKQLAAAKIENTKIKSEKKA